MNFLQHDQARVAAMKGRSASPLDRPGTGIAILNTAAAYIAAVGLGEPSHFCKFNKKNIAAVNG